MNTICNDFPISTEEYKELDEKFIKLIWRAAHELKRKNNRNNFTDDPEDIKQELIISMMRAGSYTKRQVYIEKCLDVAKKYSTEFVRQIVDELENLWTNRTRHGANKQKYGQYQEKILERIVRKIVPKKERPNKHEPLKLDSKFVTYCKSIVWNTEKHMGKQISKMKTIRNGMCSISEFDYLQ